MVQITTYMRVIQEARKAGRTEQADRMSKTLYRLTQARGYCGIVDGVVREHPDMPQLFHANLGVSKPSAASMASKPSTASAASIASAGTQAPANWQGFPVKGIVIGAVVAGCGYAAWRLARGRWQQHIENDREQAALTR